MFRHVWSKYRPSDLDDQRRHALAQSTWDSQPWEDCGVEDNQLPRLFNERGRKYPYIRDIFDFACIGLEDEDIVILTNSDIGVVDDCCVQIAFALQRNDAGYGSRRDAPQSLFVVPTTSMILQWQLYCGSDIFFCRVEWWKRYRMFFPDMIVAHEAWDPCMMIVMEKTNFNKPIWINDLCWHDPHGGTNASWGKPFNRYTLPGQRYNLQLARQFMVNNNIAPEHFGVRQA